MEDREFRNALKRIKSARGYCRTIKKDCGRCVYKYDCVRNWQRDCETVITGYEKKLWEKTAEVEKLKKELRNAQSRPQIIMDRVTAEQPAIPRTWYLAVAEFIRRNIFVEIRCDESLDDMEYVRNVLDAEAAIRAAYGDG